MYEDCPHACRFGALNIRYGIISDHIAHFGMTGCIDRVPEYLRARFFKADIGRDDIAGEIFRESQLFDRQRKFGIVV